MVALYMTRHNVPVSIRVSESESDRNGRTPEPWYQHVRNPLLLNIVLIASITLSAFRIVGSGGMVGWGGGTSEILMARSS